MVGYTIKRLKNFLASFLDDLKTYYWNYHKNFDGLFWSVLYSRIRNIRHLSSFIFFASESQALLSPINELLPCPLSPVYSKPGQPPVFFHIPISHPSFISLLQRTRQYFNFWTTWRSYDIYPSVCSLTLFPGLHFFYKKLEFSEIWVVRTERFLVGFLFLTLIRHSKRKAKIIQT